MERNVSITKRPIRGQSSTLELLRLVVREGPTLLSPVSIRKSSHHRIENGTQTPHTENKHLERPARKTSSCLNYHIHIPTFFKNCFVFEKCHRTINNLFPVKKDHAGPRAKLGSTSFFPCISRPAPRCSSPRHGSPLLAEGSQPFQEGLPQDPTTASLTPSSPGQ